MKTLFIFRGIPGSGKTTAAELLIDKKYVFSADDYFTDANGKYTYDMNKIKNAHVFCYDRVKGAMIESVDKIAIANTFTRDWEFSDYYKLAEEFGYMIVSLIVETRHSGTNIHNVPIETIKKMKQRFQVSL
jgi:predicted kinase